MRKHQSAQHEDLRKKRGPKSKEGGKKSRTLVNKEHYKRTSRPARSKSTETAQTEATVPVCKKPKALPKIPFTNCEASDVINMFNWLPPLNEDEALFHMKCPKFWRECCDKGLDPVWAYRYLMWRLGRPALSNWRLFNTLPGPMVCTGAALCYIKDEHVDNDDGESREAAISFYKNKI